MPSSLYIHIPFCHSKCLYCSFSSFPGLQTLHGRYIEALKSELKLLAEKRSQRSAPLQTIFFGGGTPSVLAAKDLVEVLDLCILLFSCTTDAEISIEVNPGTITPKQLQNLREGGFSRLSIGVQSFNAQELAILGRGHSPEEAMQAFMMAREAGFTNISLDLMYGLPGQTLKSWKSTLRQAVELQPDHLSMYQLTIEEGTPFAGLFEEGALDLPEEEVILAIDEMNISTCHKAGLGLYEISNFARSDTQCRHNINYWKNNPYLAVGAGAVSYENGVRERRVADPEEYCRRIKASQDVVVEREKLGQDASFRETVIMGLRMSEGVSRAHLRQRYGVELEEYYGEVLNKLQAQQLVELNDSHLRLTPQGRLFSNRIMAELV